MALNTKVYTGNTILIMIKNTPVGLLQDVTADEDFAPEPASGIGDPRVVEYIPTMYRVSLAVSSMSIKKDSLFSIGVFPENIDKYLAENPFVVQIIDKYTGNTIRYYNNCIFARGTVSVRKHTIVAHNCTLLAVEGIAGDADGFVQTSQT
jgi:hypothetical protein